MVDLRRLDAGRLLLLAVVPTLYGYRLVVRGTTPTGLELAYGAVVVCLLVGASVVEGGIRSPLYLLLFGLSTLAFAGVRFARGGTGESVPMLVAGAGLLLWGVAEFRSRRTDAPAG